MHIASIGIDLGKTTFHLVALGERSKVLVRKKFSRTQLLAYTATLPSSLIGLEACAGAHFLGAALRGQGHEVRLIPGQSIKPYRKSNKNDFIDGEAIAEAVSKENMRFVPIKTQEQLDVQALHRVRDRLVQRRTALINQIRGFLLERGITFAAKPIHLRNKLPALMEDAEQNLSPRLRWLLQRLWQECQQLQRDIQAITEEIERLSQENALCQRLRQIPGFGPLVATATVAAIGNGAGFRRGRDFAAWVGVVPRQYSTGGKQKLFGISKRGDVYLRRMLFTAHARCCFVSSTTLEDSDTGCIDWRSGHHATKSWLPSRINWLASPGPSCLAAEIIDISRCNRRRLNAGRGKDAALGKHRTLSTFPPPPRRIFAIGFLPRSAEKRRRRKNSPTACRKTCWCECALSDRPIYKDRHARIIIKCPESDSPLRGRIHLRGLSLRPTSNLLQSGGGPYIHANYPWNVLEDHFQIVLANAQHIKAVPVRKTDTKDCQWIAELLQLGMVVRIFVAHHAAPGGNRLREGARAEAGAIRIHFRQVGGWEVDLRPLPQQLSVQSAGRAFWRGRV